MKTSLIAFLLFGFLSLPALGADQNVTFCEEARGMRTLVPYTDDTPMPATGDRAYDNWRFPGASDPRYRGQTSLPHKLRIGPDEVADDAFLVSWSPSIINDVAWTYSNMSLTQSITVYRATIRFYDNKFRLLGEDSALYSGQTTPPGSSTRVSTDGGFFQQYNFPTTQHMFISIQFSDMVNFDVNDVGILYGGPITAGDSSRFIRNLTTGEQIDLGDTPQANLGFFIDTVPIPTPSGVVALSAAATTLTRRRR
jgi:hypothetical protein